MTQTGKENDSPWMGAAANLALCRSAAVVVSANHRQPGYSLFTGDEKSGAILLPCEYGV